jgi:hypothetical protein
MGLWGASPAFAEPKDTEAAKRHYLLGKDALGKNDTDRAVREFVQAYELSKDPAMFKQIGAAYESGGRSMEAAIYYRRYLNEVANAPDADEIRKKIEKLDAPPSSPIPPPTPAPPPTAEAKPAPPAATAIPKTPASFVEEDSHGWRTAGWVSVGLAAVALTTGAVLATSAQAREEDVQRLLDYRDPATGQPRPYNGATKDEYDSKVDEGEKLNRYSLIAFIGAGACAAAATIFFIVDGSSGRKADKEKAKVTVQPFIGPGTAGVVGRF